jgi:Uncharacterized protein conserved in bacteria (DUF2325)
MRIAWIGGVTRNRDLYTQEARQRGHVLETHDGIVGGRGSTALRALIARSDVVIALTEVNSHGAVELARRTSRELDKPFELVRRCGAARFRTFLEAFESKSAYVGSAAGESSASTSAANERQ